MSLREWSVRNGPGGYAVDFSARQSGAESLTGADRSGFPDEGARGGVEGQGIAALQDVVGIEQAKPGAEFGEPGGVCFEPGPGKLRQAAGDVGQVTLAFE